MLKVSGILLGLLIPTGVLVIVMFAMSKRWLLVPIFILLVIFSYTTENQ